MVISGCYGLHIKYYNIDNKGHIRLLGLHIKYYNMDNNGHIGLLRITY